MPKFYTFIFAFFYISYNSFNFGFLTTRDFRRIHLKHRTCLPFFPVNRNFFLISQCCEKYRIYYKYKSKQMPDRRAASVSGRSLHPQPILSNEFFFYGLNYNIPEKENQLHDPVTRRNVLKKEAPFSMLNIPIVHLSSQIIFKFPVP